MLALGTSKVPFSWEPHKDDECIVPRILEEGQPRRERELKYMKIMAATQKVERRLKIMI